MDKSAAKKRRIAIFGGTFDPIHLGHLILAEEARRILALDQVIFVPAFIPPHKKIASGVSPSQRLKMVRLAIKNNPYFGLCDWETRQNRKSYSVETVKQFKKRYPRDKIFFLAGSDCLGAIKNWKDLGTILRLAEFIVAERPGYRPRGNFFRRLKMIKIQALDISSRQIRSRMAKHLSVRYFLPEAVRSYILRNKIYD
jgi:nicotinate-nucleotide adenylyltransferase